MPERSATDDMISGLNHITLAVRDIDRSFRFYVETLGARPLARWSRGVYLLVGELWLCLTLDEGPAPRRLRNTRTSRSASPPPGSAPPLPGFAAAEG